MDDVKGLKIIHLNIRSLVPKIDLLHAWVDLHKPNLIKLSESWLNSNICNNPLQISYSKRESTDANLRERADLMTAANGHCRLTESALITQI